MNKFGDLSIGAAIFLFILVLIEVFYYTDDTDYSRITLEKLDIDGDGTVSRSELKHYLLEVERKKNIKQIKKHDLSKSVVSGIVRGFMMGLILNSFEGGLVLGLILGIVNPILTGTEKMFM